MTEDSCEKCHGTGRVMESDGTIHTCWDCLVNGRLDAHTKDLKDSKIRV